MTAAFVCKACGRPIDQDENIRIGCRLYPDRVQEGIAYVVTKPREIFLFHAEHAPAQGDSRTGGYQLDEVRTLAAAITDGRIIVG